MSSLYWCDEDCLLDLVSRVDAGDVAFLQEAMERGFDPWRHLLAGDSVLSHIRNERALRHVRDIIGTVDIPGDHGMTPLINAVIRNDSRRVRVLLQLGACPEVRTSSGDNALHIATVEPSSPEIAQRLVQAACVAGLTAENDFGDTPLTQAIRWGHVSHVKAYLARWIELDAPVDLRVGADRSTLLEHLEQSGMGYVLAELRGRPRHA